jgi:3-oxosteroid 1-dehydrogenase
MLRRIVCREVKVTWDHAVDLLVVGSGGAGHCAALRARDLGLDVLMVEKLPRWGGNTAMSAGAIWIPAHPWSPAPDTEDDGVRYLLAATGGDEGRLRAFVREGSRMLAYLVARSRLSLRCMESYPDYHDELPGGRAGGRGLETEPIDGELLGADFATLERPYPGELMLGKFMMSIPEARRLLEPGASPYLALARGALGYAWRARRRGRLGGRDPYLTMGQALMARLRLSLRDRGVPLWLEAPLVELVLERGRVVGAVVRRGGREVRIEARRGVVIAAGGFERNDEMRQQYHRKPTSASWSVGSLGNTGDGIRLGAQVGARLDEAQMGEAWWTPATRPPGDDYNAVMVIEKSLPHGIFVNRLGERFTNEAASYTAVVQAMYADHEATGANVPCWWVLDATYRWRFPMGPIEPARITSDEKLAARSPQWAPGAGWLHKAATLDALAAQMQVPAAALRETVERFNAHARQGADPDFHRGANANDRYYADVRVEPNPSLGPVETAPFYAVQVFPSDLGTKAGLATDAGGRVLDGADQPIPGLYAAGNSKTSAMGAAYPGPGVTIAEALTSGFLAAESAAAEPAR